MLCRSMYPLGSRLKIGRFRKENILYKFLRVTIVKRKPRALYLNDYPVPLLERVVVPAHVDFVFRYRIGSYGLCLFKTLTIASSKDLARYHQLVTRHLRIRQVFG